MCVRVHTSPGLLHNQDLYAGLAMVTADEYRAAAEVSRLGTT